VSAPSLVLPLVMVTAMLKEFPNRAMICAAVMPTVRLGQRLLLLFDATNTQ